MLPALRALVVLSLPLGLAACGDPLRNVDRLSEVQIAEAAAAPIAPMPADQADAPGFLTRLMDGTLLEDDSAPVVNAVAEAGALSATADPAFGSGTVSAMGTAAVVGPAPGGDPLTDLPADLSEAGAGSDVVAGADGAILEGTEAGAAIIPVAGVDVMPPIGTDLIPGDTEMDAASAPTEPAPRRQGVFGLLNRLGTEQSAAAPGTGPDAAVIAPGQTLAYGQIATVCGLSASDLGQPIGAESGYTVYDTNPASIDQRTHYITGFEDGCARQIQAALVLFGDVGTHEVIRYSDGTRDLPFSDTDNAYEEIKARVCGASARQPCGRALDQLARRTTFLTVYANFGENPEWADILLSDGAVVAMDFKG
jgi:hypothetical protein